MLNRPSNGFIKRVVVLVGVLLAMSAMVVLSNNSENVVFAQEAGTIMYAENGDGPVRSFHSEDPEGANIHWDVTGLDADDFEISASGVLTFVKSPNYESPSDRAREADASVTPAITAVTGDDNMYQITIRASEMRRVGYSGRALSTEVAVTVQVTNVNEDGVVELNWLRPEVATPITASLTDPDVVDDTPTWEWSVSKVTNPHLKTLIIGLLVLVLGQPLTLIPRLGTAWMVKPAIAPTPIPMLRWTRMVPAGEGEL